MTRNTKAPRAYFTQEAGGFTPTALARNPWFEGAIAGGPTAALIGVAIEQAGFDPGFNIARLTIDLLGRVPDALLTPRVTPVRAGRQMQLHRIELMSDGRPAAQAHVLLCRDIAAPDFPAPCDYPPPENVADGTALIGAPEAGVIRSKPVAGGVREPGRGTIWLTMDGQIVAGTTPSPFVTACMFADFGNGVGCATHADEWSYANLDINIQFLRMPKGEWILLDAATISSGNGNAVAQNVMADRQGVFAIGTQTVFVAPGSAGIKLNMAER